MEKWPFYRAATAGLGKYCTGGYGRIGVYRVNQVIREGAGEHCMSHQEGVYLILIFVLNL